MSDTKLNDSSHYVRYLVLTSMLPYKLTKDQNRSLLLIVLIKVMSDNTNISNASTSPKIN
jgi:hypothetical protein